MKRQSTFVTLVFLLLASCGDPRVIEVTLSEKHKIENTDKVRVEIPKAYELAQIAYALAEAKQESHGRTFEKSSYYKEVLAHFESNSDHPAIDAVQFWKWPDYWSYRQNSIAYSYDNGQLLHDGVYETFWRRGEDKFAAVKTELEAFAGESGFAEFYADHANYYARLEDEFSNIIDPKSMQSWLNSNFTARYDSYLIVLSPLVGGAHNFAIIQDKDYAEAVITISAPNIFDKYRDDAGNISDKAALRYSRLIFTELDHNYVNPASDQFKKEIKAAMPDVSTWNESNDYRSAEATFNEYVTWAIFALFVRDAYGDEHVRAAIDDINKSMKRRGFVRFSEFSKWITSFDPLAQGSNSVEELYPEIIAWFSTQ